MENTTTKNLRNFVCIDYPGFVKNENEAIRTLGGLDRVEAALQRRNGKFLLNFTPDNIFSKMIGSNMIENVADNHEDLAADGHDSSSTTDHENMLNISSNSLINTSSKETSNKFNDLLSMPCLLMSVKATKKNGKTEVKSVNIIGKVKRIFYFQNIADFQYLPMNSVSKTLAHTPNTTTITFNAFYDSFLFNNIQSYEYELRKNMLPQVFVLPPFFSRFDDPVNYAFRSEPTKKNPSDNVSSGDKKIQETGITSEKKLKNKLNDKEDRPNELIQSMRQERSSQAILCTFKDKHIPNKPSDKLRPPRNETISECVNTLTELFKKRPCYLKSVLLCETTYSQAILKESLPYVAYYFTTGPWRSCWIRYGYDPRKQPEAKLYQMIDYRLRYYSEPEQMVKVRPRSSYHKRKFRSDVAESDSDDYKNFKFEKDMYKFNANKLPPSRNIFYQLCDIDDEDVQALIKSDSILPPNCNEKDGWCTNNIQNKCRDLMSQKHEKLSKQLMSEQKESKKLKQ